MKRLIHFFVKDIVFGHFGTQFAWQYKTVVKLFLLSFTKITKCTLYLYNNNTGVFLQKKTYTIILICFESVSVTMVTVALTFCIISQIY